MQLWTTLPIRVHQGSSGAIIGCCWIEVMQGSSGDRTGTDIKLRLRRALLCGHVVVNRPHAGAQLVLCQVHPRVCHDCHVGQRPPGLYHLRIAKEAPISSRRDCSMKRVVSRGKSATFARGMIPGHRRFSVDVMPLLPSPAFATLEKNPNRMKFGERASGQKPNHQAEGCVALS